jgi:hypothetical protein
MQEPGPQQGREIEILKAQKGRQGSESFHLAQAPEDQWTEDILHRVSLEIRGEPGGSLARVREDQDLAASERRKVGIWLWARGLNLDLPRYQGLKRLVALRLVVLHRGASVAGQFPTHTARTKLTAGTAIDILIFLARGTIDPIPSEEDLANALTQ